MHADNFRSFPMTSDLNFHMWTFCEYFKQPFMNNWKFHLAALPSYDLIFKTSLSDRGLSFKEISLNWRNLDLFKENFKEVRFLRIF